MQEGSGVNVGQAPSPYHEPPPYTSSRAWQNLILWLLRSLSLVWLYQRARQHNSPARQIDCRCIPLPSYNGPHLRRPRGS